MPTAVQPPPHYDGWVLGWLLWWVQVIFAGRGSSQWQQKQCALCTGQTYCSLCGEERAENNKVLNRFVRQRQLYHVKALPRNEIQSIPQLLVPDARLRPGLQVHGRTGKAFLADFGPERGAIIRRTKWGSPSPTMAA